MFKVQKKRKKQDSEQINEKSPLVHLHINI